MGLSTWTPQRVDSMLALLAGGTSAENIAGELQKQFEDESITRNAVISKINRLRKNPDYADKVPKSPPQYSRAARPKAKAPEKSKTWKPGQQIAPDDSEVPPEGIPFLDRRWGQCPFPLWPMTVRTGNVCGRSCLGRYCKRHSRIAFQPPRLR